MAAELNVSLELKFLSIFHPISASFFKEMVRERNEIQSKKNSACYLLLFIHFDRHLSADIGTHLKTGGDKN